MASIIKNAKNSTETKQQLQLLLEDIFTSQTYYRHELIGKYLVNGIGGIAEHLVIAENTGEVVSAAKAAISAKEPYIVIAHGTGSLVSHIGFPGLVIINKTNNIVCTVSSSIALVDSGVANAELVNVLATEGLGALEFLSAIPGTIGGAVATNASYGGKHILSYVKELIMFVADVDGGKVVSFSASDLPKNNRSLMFPKSENSPIILSVRLQLARIAQTEIMRRLSALRQQSKLQKETVTTVGYYCSPPVSKMGLPERELRSIGLPRGISFNKKDYNLLDFRGENTPDQIREALQTIGRFLRARDLVLDERLSYLGYWPGKEEDSITANTESFSV